MAVLAALMVAAAVWSVYQSATGNPIRWHRRTQPTNRRRLSRRAWLAQAGAPVTPAQFWTVCLLLGAVTFLLVFTLDRSTAVALVPALGAAAAPYGYWATQRRNRVAAVITGWPDVIRRLRSGLGSGIATLHEALSELAVSGPEGLRPAMIRYTHLAAQLGTGPALEQVRAELADPISDGVLLTLQTAATEGTSTVLVVLEGLLDQATREIALADKIRTLQSQSRIAAWACLVIPYFLLVVFSATQPAYRSFYDTTLGLVIVLLCGAMSTIGFALVRILGRSIPTSHRVFTAERSAR